MSKKAPWVTATAAGFTLLLSCAANAQNYSGAGSTIQPSQQYQQQQRQQQAEAQRRANTYYYQPAPPVPTQQQIQTQNNQALNAWKPLGGCVGGAVMGSFTAPPPVGQVGGCIAGGLGITKFGSLRRAFGVEQAY